MDIELLRTFLEVARTRHFGKAADKLCVTQSAVSARIRQLEQTLDKPLFTRSRNNIQLTHEGQQLRKHAETIVQVWSRARQETGLGEAYSRALVIGAVPDLWYTLLDGWLQRLRLQMTDTALQAEATTSDILIRKLLDNVIDLAILFDVPQLPEFEIRELAAIRLVLAATQPGQPLPKALGAGYILVDWGTAFNMQHTRHYPDIAGPALRMNQGLLAWKYLQQSDGAAYLPEQLLAQGAGIRPLYQVEGASIIERPVYAVFASTGERVNIVQEALQFMRS